MWQDPYDSYLGNPAFLVDPWLSMQWHQQQCHQQQWQPHWANQWMDVGDGVVSSGSTDFHDSAVQCLETRPKTPTLEETVEMLQKIKEELEMGANRKLQNSLKIALQNEVNSELRTFIERAIFFFDYEGADSTPKGAMDALKHAKQARKIWEIPGDKGDHGKEFGEELHAAVKKVRDTLSVRTQLEALPMGDKKRYQAVLKQANGGIIDDEENSQLMQSYRKIIWEQFEEAFPSNNKKENLKRGGPRPRRERVKRPRPPRSEDDGFVRPPPGLEIGFIDDS